MDPSRPSEISIRALGCCTSLGGAVGAAAAFRAGLNRSSELLQWPYFDERNGEEAFLVGHPVQGITDGFDGPGRLIRMGVCAMDDIAELPALAGAGRAALYLAIDEPSAADDEELSSPPQGDLIMKRICDLVKDRTRWTHQRVYREGRVGAMRALIDAVSDLRSGRCERCVVGGVDSWMTSRRLNELVLAGKAKTADEPDGLAPGEAAAFVVLESARAGRSPANRIDVRITEPHITDENQHPTSPESTGRAQADALLAVLKAGASLQATSGTIYPDLTGDIGRAREWGHALARTRAACKIESWSQEISAAGFGDVGAASPVLAMCLAVRAFHRGYASGRHALILTGTDQGTCGAALLELHT